MSCAASISTFNDELLRAKVAALRILQDLMNTLADPDPPVPARFRELRLLAAAILRTQPMKAARHTDAPPPPNPPEPLATPPPPDSPPTHRDSVTPPLSHASTPHARFNPHQEWARAAIRSLVNQGFLGESYSRFARRPP